MNIKVSSLREDAVIPTRKNSKDAGLDIYAYLPEMEYYKVYPGDTVIFRTGVTVEIPSGYFGWLTNKSRNDFIIGAGIVDETYQGELLVKIINTTDESIDIVHGQAIAQLLIIPCITPEVEVVDVKDIHQNYKTIRGMGGGIVSQLKRYYDKDDDGGIIGDGTAKWWREKFNKQLDIEMSQLKLFIDTDGV